MRLRRRDSCRRAGGHDMLSRKVVTRSGRGFRGYFPSKKLNRSVEFESILERDAIIFFENFSEVISFQEQPTIIYYYLQEEQKKYFPDFELKLIGGEVVHVEIKPSVFLTLAKISAKYHAIAKSYISRPEHFVILTEMDLRGDLNVDFYQLILSRCFRFDEGNNYATI